MEIILWDFLIFYGIFLSLQVNQSAIISNEQSGYELLRNLPNNLKLKILGKLGKVRKISKRARIIN